MAIQSDIIEMLYYLILFLSVLFASSFLIIVFVALLRIVVNQQYPPLTKEYLSAEIVESICLCFVIVSALFGWIPSDLQRRYLSNSSETLNIIIVPGYEMNRFSSMFLQKYLEARGHRVWAINNIFFADNLGQIIDTTRERILEICRQNELTEKINLLGNIRRNVETQRLRFLESCKTQEASIEMQRLNYVGKFKEKLLAEINQKLCSLIESNSWLDLVCIKNNDKPDDNRSSEKKISISPIIF